MKKIAFISVPLMAISFLVGCGGQSTLKQYTVTVTSEDTSKGTVSGGGSYTSGSSVTINASPSAGYKFEGWYDQSSKISPLVSYTFTMPASDVSYVAKFDVVKPWYQKNDWWNYCSSGVVGEQAIDADIGKEVDLTVNSQIHKVRLIDIDHDVLSDDESKKAHCTFEFSNLLSDSSGYSIATLWNTSGDNNSTNYDYLNSDLRKALDGQGTGTLRWYQKGLGTKATDPDYTKAVIDMLPSELKNNIKTVKKEVVTGSSYSTKNYNANVFALTYREMTKNGSSSYAKEEGKTYKYYVDNDANASRVKHQIKWHTEAVTSKKQITDLNWNPSSYAGYNSTTNPEGGYYWFTSPHIRGKSGGWSAGMSGALNFYNVYEVAFAVAPAFCI